MPDQTAAREQILQEAEAAEKAQQRAAPKP
jgi:hypothetical protein